MSAIYTIYRASNGVFPGRRSVQFGFPYVDTLKIQQDLGPGVHFFHRGDERELQQLGELLETEPVSAIFCEFPSNPLLISPNYPKYCTAGNDAAVQREGAGYGGLFSLVLRAPERTTQRFFDSLQFCKGPNLGTYFSLCCPFTLLAHFQELEWAEDRGVSRYLLRFSVGLESPACLIDRLSRALAGL